jgi:hypothetical protein
MVKFIYILGLLVISAIASFFTAGWLFFPEMKEYLLSGFLVSLIAYAFIFSGIFIQFHRVKSMVMFEGIKNTPRIEDYIVVLEAHNALLKQRVKLLEQENSRLSQKNIEKTLDIPAGF